LGSEGLKLIQSVNSSKRQTVKLDLDGILKNGSASDKDTGYEIVLKGYGKTVYIKSLVDKSYVQIVTDSLNARQSVSLSGWNPKIYLQSAKSDEISLKDTVEAAWKKMEISHIYEWVFSNQNHKNQPDLLSHKILYTLRLLAKNRSISMQSKNISIHFL